MSDEATILEGTYQTPEGARFGIVAGRFNHFITDRLVEGALDALVRHGVPRTRGADGAGTADEQDPQRHGLPFG